MTLSQKCTFNAASQKHATMRKLTKIIKASNKIHLFYKDDIQVRKTLVSK